MYTDVVGVRGGNIYIIYIYNIYIYIYIIYIYIYIYIYIWCGDRKYIMLEWLGMHTAAVI